jgi:hypothetical protein
MRFGRKVTTVGPPLGLDSITFDTFGWAPVHRDGARRAWQGDEVVLIENFFADRPSLPSLDPDAIRVAYEDQADEPDTRRGRLLRRVARREGDRTRKVIEVVVAREGSVPIVRTIVRLPLPDRYLYSGSLTMPLAECSWVIQVQAPESGETGIREAVAFAQFLNEGNAPAAGQDSPADLMAGFDAYDARWDGLIDDPLSAVRRHIDLVEGSLRFAPPVLAAAPFS